MMWRLFCFANDFRLEFTVGIIVTVINGVIFALTGLFLAKVIAEMLKTDSSSSYISQNILYLFIIGIVTLFTYTLQSILFNKIGS